MQVRAKYIISVYTGAFSNADFFVRVMKPGYYLRGVSEMFMRTSNIILVRLFCFDVRLKCPKEESHDTPQAAKQSDPSKRSFPYNDVTRECRSWYNACGDVREIQIRDTDLSIVDCVKTSCKSTSCRKLITCRKVRRPVNSRQDLWLKRERLEGLEGACYKNALIHRYRKDNTTPAVCDLISLSSERGNIASDT